MGDREMLYKPNRSELRCADEAACMSGDIYDFLGLGEEPEPNEVTFAEGRLTTRTYATRSFTAALDGT